ncbi:hypothetical protein FB451DRAFT_1363645 [Mycena latifolia]|nr:hypothetical protein FB451DRAFT_1363645 [Mycena latifolia]
MDDRDFYRTISQHDLIECPIHFSEGQFKGYTIRAELIILLRFYVSCFRPDDQTFEEELQNYDEIDISGMICMADVFRAVDAAELCTSLPKTKKRNSSLLSSEASSSGFSDAPVFLYSTPDPRLHNFVPSKPTSPPPGQFSNSVILLYPGAQNVSDVSMPQKFRPFMPATPDDRHMHFIVVRFEISPTSRVSVTLDGQKRRVLVFVFHDLSLKITGPFVFRFRFFDISASPTGFL